MRTLNKKTTDWPVGFSTVLVRGFELLMLQITLALKSMWGSEPRINLLPWPALSTLGNECVWSKVGNVGNVGHFPCLILVHRQKNIFHANVKSKLVAFVSVLHYYVTSHNYFDLNSHAICYVIRSKTKFLLLAYSASCIYFKCWLVNFN